MACGKHRSSLPCNARFIADDHGVLRGGLRALINANADMEVVGEAANGPDAERGIKETEPDIALMDISMPGGRGLSSIAAIKRVRPRTRFIVLSVGAAAPHDHESAAAGNRCVLPIEPMG